MVRFRLATWNINSVRLRIDLVRNFVNAHKIDVLCLQEIKTETPSFPADAISALGLVHHAVLGQKGYHGVAILSRLPLNKVQSETFGGKDEARHLRVTLPGQVELHNFYVPAGGDLPDPKKNEKFKHKLNFLDDMTAHFSKQRNKKSARRILVGDLNVAPFENDVWSHKQLLDVVSHTPVETERMQRIYESHDWIDVTRSVIGAEEKIFSWWSYRNQDWKKSDRGRRLDHVWMTPALKGSVQRHEILKDARDWEKPSDHVPVVVDFEVDD